MSPHKEEKTPKRENRRGKTKMKDIADAEEILACPLPQYVSNTTGSWHRYVQDFDVEKFKAF